MAKKGKKYTDAAKRFDRDQLFTPVEALDLVKGLGTAKFDESVELAIRLGVDPRKADQIVRGTVALPSGTGKDVRVAVFANGEAADAARAAGADHVGGDDLAAAGGGRHARLRRRHRHPRPHAAGRQARSGARPAWPDAEPEDRHRHHRRRQGRRGVQGRQGGVPHRPLRQRPRADRQGELRHRRPPRQLHAPSSTRSSGPSRPRRRAATSRRSRCRPPWAPASGSTPTACGRASTPRVKWCRWARSRRPRRRATARPPLTSSAGRRGWRRGCRCSPARPAAGRRSTASR